jgi:hypothetical protein
MRKKLIFASAILFLVLASTSQAGAAAEDAPATQGNFSPGSAWDRSSYAGIIFGYGGFFPVADYGGAYKSSHLLTTAVPVYYLTFWHVCPELNIRYTLMNSEFDPLRFNSTMSLVEIFPALLFRWDFALPDKFLGPVQAYARVYDGVTCLSYTSVDPYTLFLRKRKTVEYINIFGFSAGCNYFLYRGLFVGVDVGYNVIATAGSPLQAISFSVQVGYRFL